MPQSIRITYIAFMDLTNTPLLILSQLSIIHEGKYLNQHKTEIIDEILKVFVHSIGPAKLTVSLLTPLGTAKSGHSPTTCVLIGSKSEIHVSSFLIRNARPNIGRLPNLKLKSECKVVAAASGIVVLQGDLKCDGAHWGSFALESEHPVHFGEWAGLVAKMTAAVLVHAFKVREARNLVEEYRNEYENLHAITESTTNLIIKTDTLGRVVWVNRAFETFTGYSLNDVVGKTPGSVLAGPETEPEKTKLLRDAIKSVSPLFTKITNYTKMGDKYFVSINLNPIFDQRNIHTGFMSVQQNIPEEEMLRQQLVAAVKDKVLFSDIAAHSLVPLFRFRIADLSREYVNAAGMKHIRKIKRHAADWDIWSSFLTACKTASTGFARELAFSDVHFICDVTFTDTGSFNVYCHDITKLRRTDQALSNALDKLIEQKKLYENILDNIPIDIALLDRDKRYRFVNKAAVKSDKIRTWIIGKTDLEYVQYRNRPKDVAVRRTSYLDQVFSGGTHPEWIEEQQMPDGTVKVIERKYHKYPDSEYAIGYGFDVTRPINHAKELQAVNEELRKTNTELDFFVYSVSHNLRSPLMSVKGIIEIIQDERHTKTAGTDVYEYIDYISAAVQRLDATIVDILNYFRNTRADQVVTEIDVQDACQVIFNDLKFFHAHPVELHLDSNVTSTFFSDEVRILSLFKNLISNSVKYADLKKPRPYVKVSVKVDKRELVFVVEDNGEGIPKEIQDRVFEMFFRGSRTSVGSGLGLYMCKEMVAKLNGTIELDSTPGLGTKITLTIPNQRPS